MQLSVRFTRLFWRMASAIGFSDGSRVAPLMMRNRDGVQTGDVAADIGAQHGVANRIQRDLPALRWPCPARASRTAEAPTGLPSIRSNTSLVRSTLIR